MGGPRPDDEAKNPELRRYGLGAQILNDIGVGKMRIMGAPRKLHSLGGYGLDLHEWVELGDDANSSDDLAALSKQLNKG